MDINKLAFVEKNVLNEEDYYVFLETYLPVIKSKNNAMVEVNQQSTYKYEGDFAGLLDSVNVDRHYHYVVMRLNGLLNHSDYKGDYNIIKLPDFSYIDTITAIYRSRNAKVL